MSEPIEIKFKMMIEKYKNLFVTDTHADLLMCNVGEHYIDTGNSNPIFCKSNKKPINTNKSIAKEIAKLEKPGSIVKSNSPWNTLIVPVTNPDRPLRMCLGSWPLNSACTKDRHQMQNISMTY